jgi:hypothetical protein
LEDAPQAILPDASSENWADSFAQALAEHRKRAEELLALQGTRVRRLDEMLERLQHRHEDLAAREAALESRRRQIDAAEARLQADLPIEARQEQPAEIAALRCRLDEELAEVAAQRDAVAVAQTRVKTQRQRIAERFKAQRATHLRGLRRRQEELRRTSPSDENLERRHELALEDVRLLKARNAELELELTRRQGGNQAAAATNWEAEKHRILATMEAEFNDKDPQQQAKRLEIQEVLETTDRAIRQKDAEIAALKQQLAGRDAMGPPGATASRGTTELLDRDEIIRRERDSIARLRKEWETKLRQAEIEISVERAKLARQRSELEEKILVAAQAASKASPGATSDRSEKPVRGRWRARLGLKDDG